MIEPRPTESVLFRVEEIIDKFFDKGSVYGGSQGPTIYIIYNIGQRRFTVGTDEKMKEDSNLLASIEWKVL